MSHHMTAAQQRRQHVRESGTGRYAPVRHPEHDLHVAGVAQPVMVARDADRLQERHLEDDYGLSASMQVARTWQMPDGTFRRAEIVTMSVANFHADANDWANGGSRIWEGIEVESGLVDPGVWEQVQGRAAELQDSGDPAASATAPRFDYFVSETYILTEYDRHPDEADVTVLRVAHQSGDIVGRPSGDPYRSVTDADRAVIDHTNRVAFDHLVPDPDLEEWFDDDSGGGVEGEVA